jgi:class 3 adenylate cyclase
MDFYEVLDQVIALLRSRGRVTYRALKRQFDLDDDFLEDLKEEIIKAQKLAVDENSEVLVWTGGSALVPPSTPASSTPQPATASATAQEPEPLSYTPKHLAEKILTSRSALEGERKQVAVLFCDLANSTAIAEKIGPENMHTLLNRFFELALHDVHRYEGTINQFLGDGFMALFGAPVSHEDHARRGVLTALALQRTLKDANLGEPYGVACTFRMGLNSGLVVVGSIGDNLRMDYSAIGDTTNLASRLQQRAEPATILISESTSRLVEGYVRAGAATHLQEALGIFASIHSRFDLARTYLDLALLAYAQGNPDTATAHLNQAYAWFKKLQVPKYVERIEQRAREYDVTLKEVELEELTEEPS